MGFNSGFKGLMVLFSSFKLFIPRHLQCGTIPDLNTRFANFVFECPRVTLYIAKKKTLSKMQIYCMVTGALFLSFPSNSV